MKRGRKHETKFDDIGPLIGKGGYAYVFVSNSSVNDFVYRIEQFTEDRLSEIEREMAIQKFLHEEKFSPCIPAIYEHEFLIEADLPERIRKIMKINDPASVNQVIIQRIEAGNMGTMLNHTDYLRQSENFQNIFFMLLWTFWVANSRYGFRHRDIKPGNIVFKKLPKETTFQFEIINRQPFYIKTKVVPLLIDYGFASLLTTREESRYLNGTYAYVPPEILAASILRPNETVNGISGNAYHEEDAFDVWSIAVAMLDVVIGMPKNDLFSLAEVNPKNFFDFEVSPNEAKKFSVLVHIIVFLNIFDGKSEDDWGPPEKLIGTMYSPFLFTKAFLEKVAMFARLNNLTTFYIKRLSEGWSDDIDNLLRRYITWDANYRVNNGYLGQKLIRDFGYLQLLPKGAVVDEIYEAKMITLFGETTDEDYRAEIFKKLSKISYIHARVCDTCGTKDPEFVCMDCSKTLCNEGCHPQPH